MVSENNSYLHAAAQEAAHLPRPIPLLQSRSGVVPLTALRAGQRGLLRAVAGGRALTARALALGLVPGTPIQVARTLGGPVVIEVRGSRLALGRGMAQRIWVEPVPSPSPAEAGERPEPRWRWRATP